ncbi:hypothetical protein CDFC105_73466 [Clostridioides difficile]|nr:hypothetical protein CDFC105_62449 [Clostridioides difficile]CZS10341.1 hypothetical protein CDFC105_73466 [Clostridioides difficile]
MEELKVTSLEELKKIKLTEIIEVGKFSDGTMLVAEVKQPDLMALAMAGKIPNSLMSTSMSLVEDKGNSNDTGEKVLKKMNEESNFSKEMFEMMDIVAREVLVNPTYAQIKKIGLELSIEQRLTLFNRIQGGTKSLENFHQEPTDIEDSKSSDNVQQDA